MKTSTSSQGGFPVNLFQGQEAEKEWDSGTTVISGRRCLELSKKIGQEPLLAKMLLESPIWKSTDSVLVWKIAGTASRSLIYRLALVDYQPWNGTSGLLPRVSYSTYKGAVRNRYRSSPTYRGNFHEAIRESQNDGIVPRPEFAEWVKGFPIGWTELKPSETHSTLKSPR